MHEVRATGVEALELATALLQRVRRADSYAGLFEAADVQWAWRAPRPSDAVEKIFWVDDEGPVGGVLLTSWTDGSWQCDPVLIPGAGYGPDLVWTRALQHVARYTASDFTIPVGDDDDPFTNLARRSGLVAGHRDDTAWMPGASRPAVTDPADGFVVVDRTQRRHEPHPMGQRNGAGIAMRLEQCSLYDPSLDLAAETAEGQVAGYSLYWYDPTTKVGLVEPVRVEAAYQRRGLAQAMLTAGIDRLVRKGAKRLKVSYETPGAAALYQGLGFRPESSTTWYRGPSR